MEASRGRWPLAPCVFEINEWTNAQFRADACLIAHTLYLAPYDRARENRPGRSSARCPFGLAGGPASADGPLSARAVVRARQSRLHGAVLAAAPRDVSRDRHGTGGGGSRVPQWYRQRRTLPRLVSAPTAILPAAAQRASPDRGLALFSGIPGGGKPPRARLRRARERPQADSRADRRDGRGGQHFPAEASQRQRAVRGGRALCRGGRHAAAPADAAPRRRGGPDRPAHPRPQRGGARRRLTALAESIRSSRSNSYPQTHTAVANRRDGSNVCWPRVGGSGCSVSRCTENALREQPEFVHDWR